MKDVAGEQAGQVANTVADKTSQVAGTAAEGARQVAGTAKEQVSEIAQEAEQEVRNLLEQAKGQLHDQTQQQTERIAQSLRELGEQLRALTEGRPEQAGNVRQYAEQAAQNVARYASQIEHRGLDGMVDDVQRFARRRPGVFLFGAAAAGFTVGRLFRSAKSAGGTASGQRSPEAARAAATSGAYVTDTADVLTPATPAIEGQGTVGADVVAPADATIAQAGRGDVPITGGGV